MLVEGRRSVQSAIEADAPLVELLVSESHLADQDFWSLLAGSSIPVYQLSEKDARRIATVETHQGILAVAKIELPAFEAFEQMNTVIALDGVQDPGNVGTIIRTAAWFGVQGILAGAGTADFFNPKVIRASMGGIWDVQLGRVDNLAQSLQALKSSGFSLVSADLEGEALKSWKPAGRIALVIGSEAHGVSAEVGGLAAQKVTIPGAGRKGGTESLNAGMAAGIILHHWLGEA